MLDSDQVLTCCLWERFAALPTVLGSQSAKQGVDVRAVLLLLLHTATLPAHCSPLPLATPPNPALLTQVVHELYSAGGAAVAPVEAAFPGVTVDGGGWYARVGLDREGAVVY